MWREVDLHGIYIFERLVGFSIPMEERIALISYEGIHIIDLREPRVVRSDGAYPEGGDLYDRRQQVLLYEDKRFQILGLFGATPILRNDRGEELLLSATEDVLQVRGVRGNIILAYEFTDLSGDWRYATFSPNGDAIVLGLPYDIHIFQRSTR